LSPDPTACGTTGKKKSPRCCEAPRIVGFSSDGRKGSQRNVEATLLLVPEKQLMLLPLHPASSSATS
jgi:hypothetical protein